MLSLLYVLAMCSSVNLIDDPWMLRKIDVTSVKIDYLPKLVLSPEWKQSLIELKLKIFPYVTNHRHCFLPIKLTAQPTKKKLWSSFLRNHKMAPP